MERVGGLDMMMLLLPPKLCGGGWRVGVVVLEVLDVGGLELGWVRAVLCCDTQACGHCGVVEGDECGRENRRQQPSFFVEVVVV
jgi:hypothetical protein